MIIWLICYLWKHKTIHKAMTGTFPTIDRLTGQMTTGHYYRWDRTPFCTRCGRMIHEEKHEETKN